MRGLPLALVVLISVCRLCSAQAPAPTPDALLNWSFDADVGGWTAVNNVGEVSVVHDAQLIRSKESGGVLQYAYTPGGGQMPAIITPTEAGLGNAKSLHYWLKTSRPALMMMLVAEQGGGRYQLGFSSLPNRWQEIDVDLSEFRPAEDARDDNGRLDLDQVRALGLIDMTMMLAQLAEKVPVLVPPEPGARKLWLDDVAVDAVGVAPRWAQTQVGGKPAVRLDSFERAPLQWFVMTGKGIEVEYDREHKVDGDFSLRARYDLPAGKVFGMMTSLEGVPLQGTKGIALSVMSETGTTLLVELKEGGGAKYQAMVAVAPGDAFQAIDLPIDQLKLSEESPDPNGRLDMDQLKELTIADISIMTGTPVPTNTLWFDSIVFPK